MGELLHILLTFLFQNTKLSIKKKKKKKPTLIFPYFGSVGKGQTNIFFFFKSTFVHSWHKIMLFWLTCECIVFLGGFHFDWKLKTFAYFAIILNTVIQILITSYCIETKYIIIKHNPYQSAWPFMNKTWLTNSYWR